MFKKILQLTEFNYFVKYRFKCRFELSRIISGTKFISRTRNVRAPRYYYFFFPSMLNFTIPPYSIAFAHEKAAAQQYLQM